MKQTRKWWVLLVALQALLLMLIAAASYVVYSTKTDTTQTSNSHRHPDDNVYWKYLNHSVKQTNITNSTACIVCSLLSHHSAAPFVFSIKNDSWETVNDTWVRHNYTAAMVKFLRNITNPSTDVNTHWTAGTKFPVCFYRHEGGNNETDREAVNDCVESDSGAEKCVRLNGTVSSWQKGLRETSCNSSVNLEKDAGGWPTFNTDLKIYIPDWYWNCGNGKLWLFLPKLQRGRCTLVRLNSHTTVYVPDKTQRRTKRYASKGQAPDEHKLVSEGTRFAEIMFPNFGVGNVRVQLNVVHYRLAQFVNETLLAMEGVRQELTALRVMAMQHRMVLDMLLAKEGGVCVMIGEECCSYIPANDEPGGNISQAMDHMRQVADQLRRDETPELSYMNWIFSMFSSWRAAFTALVPVLVCVLILLCCLPLCCQCVSSAIQHAVTTQYQLLQTGDDSVDEGVEEFEPSPKDLKTAFIV